MYVHARRYACLKKKKVQELLLPSVNIGPYKLMGIYSRATSSSRSSLWRPFQYYLRNTYQKSIRGQLVCRFFFLLHIFNQLVTERLYLLYMIEYMRATSTNLIRRRILIGTIERNIHMPGASIGWFYELHKLNLLLLMARLLSWASRMVHSAYIIIWVWSYKCSARVRYRCRITIFALENRRENICSRK